MPWGAIVRSPVMVGVLVAELGRIIEDRVLSVKVRRGSSNEPWFYDLCSNTFRKKQAAYHSWRSSRTPASLFLFGESSVRLLPAMRMLALGIMESAERSLLQLLQLEIGGAY